MSDITYINIKPELSRSPYPRCHKLLKIIEYIEDKHKDINLKIEDLVATEEKDNETTYTLSTNQKFEDATYYTTITLNYDSSENIYVVVYPTSDKDPTWKCSSGNFPSFEEESFYVNQ